MKGPVIFVSGLMALAVAPSAVGQTPPSADLQIRLAVQAAPAALRDGATVQAYDASGAPVTLR